MRIIIACRELGIKTVAVYSEADEHALHVRFADEDVRIGPPRSSESYLNVPAIISAAEITGADAIHPGYGFLSESAYLAEVCEACHIRFIGPDPKVIRLMGDKARARRAMKKAGLPLLPGTDGPVEDEEAALKFALTCGFPVIVKATAGGGGRGMRVVRTAQELGHAIKTAQREAEAAFGVPDVYIEKYLENPRHIEIQVLGDHHGGVVHLGERECSIQRRHQKLLEESPSPALTEKQRRKLGNLVVDAAKAVQYTNAGTFEFLMDEQARFYFMEANTRLQVEHPVTELVTGVDIVKEQIRIAAGERLSFRQGEITFNGHAIECRVNAEDPETFVPSPGHISVFSLGGGPGIRVDTAAHSDCTIPPYYDSMIAKVISYGRDRHEAVVRMKRALEMSVVEGVKTTIPMHLRILNDPDFLAGRLSTKFMERFAPATDKDKNSRRGCLNLSPLNAIIDDEVTRRSGWTVSGAGRRVSRGRRPLHPNPKQTRGERRVPRHVRGCRDARAQGGRDRHRERSRRHREAVRGRRRARGAGGSRSGVGPQNSRRRRDRWRVDAFAGSGARGVDAGRGLYCGRADLRHVDEGNGIPRRRHDVRERGRWDSSNRPVARSRSWRLAGLPSSGRPK